MLTRDEYEAKARWLLGPSYEPTGMRLMPNAPPVCAGRGDQPPCKHHSMTATHWCHALYNVVTGEEMVVDCQQVRSFDRECGREGKLYEPAA